MRDLFEFAQVYVEWIQNRGQISNRPETCAKAETFADLPLPRKKIALPDARVRDLSNNLGNYLYICISC